MTTLLEPPAAPSSQHEPPPRSQLEDSGSRGAWTLATFIFATMALLAAIFGVGLGVRAVDQSKSTSSATKGGGAPAETPAAMVHLSDFKLEPAEIDATTGAGIDVMNMGATAHNLAVEGTALATPMIEAGKAGHLDVSSLAPGTYTLVCQVPGHREAGMHAV